MKGFMRMTEALISLIILIFVFLQVTSNLLAQQSSEDVTLIPLLSSYLNTISRLDSTKEVLENYDFSQVDFLFSKLAERIPIKVELEYNLKNIEIFNPTNQTLNDQIIAFTYNFPLGIDENSIRIAGEEGEYQVEVRKVWFRIPIRIETPMSIENGNITIDNLYLDTFGEGKINNQSIKFFVNGVKAKVELRNYVELSPDGSKAKINITFNIPELAAGLNKCYLYYSTNDSISTLFPETYFSLEETTFPSLTILIGAPEKSYTFDILAKVPQVDAYERKDLTLSFKVGTSEQRMFGRFNFQNPSSLIVNLLENSIKDGGSYIATKTYSGKAYVYETTVSIDEGFVKVRLYGWSR